MVKGSRVRESPSKRPLNSQLSHGTGDLGLGGFTGFDDDELQSIETPPPRQQAGEVFTPQTDLESPIMPHDTAVAPAATRSQQNSAHPWKAAGSSTHNSMHNSSFRSAARGKSSSSSIYGGPSHNNTANRSRAHTGHSAAPSEIRERMYANAVPPDSLEVSAQPYELQQSDWHRQNKLLPIVSHVLCNGSLRTYLRTILSAFLVVIAGILIVRNF
eukprot:16971-Heterococcus_DN1.PRE.2